MRNRNATCALYVFLLAAPALAQTPGADSGAAPASCRAPSWAFNDLACAPALLTTKRDKTNARRRFASSACRTRRIASCWPCRHSRHQRRVERRPPDRVSVFRAARRTSTATTGPTPPATIHTAGWVQILGVDTMVSTATILHACEGILLDDYLEPFVAPMVAARPLPGTMPQYDNMGHIVTGIEGLHTAAPGNYMTIDRGSSAGVVVGQRFLVFRDKRELSTSTRPAARRPSPRMVKQSPLVEIGEVLVVAVRPDDATVQVVASQRRDRDGRSDRAYR